MYNLYTKHIIHAIQYLNHQFLARLCKVLMYEIVCKIILAQLRSNYTHVSTNFIPVLVCKHLRIMPAPSICSIPSSAPAKYEHFIYYNLSKIKGMRVVRCTIKLHENMCKIKDNNNPHRATARKQTYTDSYSLVT